MAKEDATEQVKEVLRQVIKYRFWISVGFAALFAVIAYFVGAGPVQAKANAERPRTITDAEKDVRQYTSRPSPTDQYKPIVEEKTEIVTKDVNKAWKELYDRQAPLLTWPETVQDRFRKWGRKWPETRTPARSSWRSSTTSSLSGLCGHGLQDVQSVRLRDRQGDRGRAAPRKRCSGRPSSRSRSTPDLGKVWAAQERLWIQRTLLEVVARSTRTPKDWDSAIVKEIVVLEVGNPCPGPAFARQGRAAQEGRRRSLHPGRRPRRRGGRRRRRAAACRWRHGRCRDAGGAAWGP